MSLPRILLVTGKGGVGKSTVAASLALHCARQGERTILVETSGAQTIAPWFGRSSQGYTPISLAPQLSTLSVTPREALEDYVVQQIRVRRLFKLVFENRVMVPFIDAVPGLHDALQLGKVFDLSRETTRGRHTWDRIIVDAPATGHGLTMLGSARAMMDMTGGGPMFEGLRLVHEVLDDPSRTGLVLVALPEEMPVNETLHLWQQLGESQRQVQLCVVNQLQPWPVSDTAWAAATPALHAQSSPAISEGIDLVNVLRERAIRHQAARARLEAGLAAPVAALPVVPERPLSPSTLADFGRRLHEALP